MRWEQVPDLPLFTNNTAAFIHDLDADAISSVDGESNDVGVQVLTPVGVLDRDKQLGVVRELTEIVAAAAGDPSLRERTWVLLTESPEGGWGSADTRTRTPTSQRPRGTRGFVNRCSPLDAIPSAAPPFKNQGVELSQILTQTSSWLIRDETRVDLPPTSRRLGSPDVSPA
jgi:phenylpyruvate tautomerase PptA (4-oxalocrotonate tautomerase family)